MIVGRNVGAKVHSNEMPASSQKSNESIVTNIRMLAARACKCLENLYQRNPSSPSKVHLEEAPLHLRDKIDVANDPNSPSIVHVSNPTAVSDSFRSGTSAFAPRKVRTIQNTSWQGPPQAPATIVMDMSREKVQLLDQERPLRKEVESLEEEIGPRESIFLNWLEEDIQAFIQDLRNASSVKRPSIGFSLDHLKRMSLSEFQDFIQKKRELKAFRDHLTSSEFSKACEASSKPHLAKNKKVIQQSVARLRNALEEAKKRELPRDVAAFIKTEEFQILQKEDPENCVLSEFFLDNGPYSFNIENFYKREEVLCKIMELMGILVSGVQIRPDKLHMLRTLTQENIDSLRECYSRSRIDVGMQRNNEYLLILLNRMLAGSMRSISSSTISTEEFKNLKRYAEKDLKVVKKDLALLQEELKDIDRILADGDFANVDRSQEEILAEKANLITRINYCLRRIDAKQDQLAYIDSILNGDSPWLLSETTDYLLEVMVRDRTLESLQNLEEELQSPEVSQNSALQKRKQGKVEEKKEILRLINACQTENDMNHLLLSALKDSIQDQIPLRRRELELCRKEAKLFIDKLKGFQAQIVFVRSTQKIKEDALRYVDDFMQKVESSVETLVHYFSSSDAQKIEEANQRLEEFSELRKQWARDIAALKQNYLEGYNSCLFTEKNDYKKGCAPYISYLDFAEEVLGLLESVIVPNIIKFSKCCEIDRKQEQISSLRQSRMALSARSSPTKMLCAVSEDRELVPEDYANETGDTSPLTNMSRSSPMMMNPGYWIRS